MKESVDKYLKRLKVNSINELSDEQIIEFFVEGSGGKLSKWGALTAKIAINNNELNSKDVVKSMKSAIMENIDFKCIYIENESANGSDDLPERYGWILEPM